MSSGIISFRRQRNENRSLSGLHGSGYVLIAFLEGELVNKYHWLTHEQLFDAIAIGQFTPGPVLSTATFIGYLVLGPLGAVIATIGIFLPSFLFVLLLNPIIPRLRRSFWSAAFLDSINVAALGLMAVVTIQLLGSSLISGPTWLIAFGTAVLLFRFQINPAWLILLGALLNVVIEWISVW